MTLRIVLVTCVSIALLAPGRVLAQPAPDDWQFRATIYGLFPSLTGSGPVPDIGIPGLDAFAETFDEHSALIAMGAFEAQKGRWGAFSDVIYLNLSGTNTERHSLSIG